MTPIRSTPADRAKERAKYFKSPRQRELLSLICVSLALIAGFYLVYKAKRLTPITFDEVKGLEAANQLLNLNRLTNSESLLPYLSQFANPNDRLFAAQKIYSFASAENSLPNVGAIARIRVDENEIDTNPKLDYFRSELANLRSRRSNTATAMTPGTLKLPLLRQLNQLKPSFIVREPEEFKSKLYVWLSLYVLAFYAVHVWWRIRGFKGDYLLLPAIHLLTGVGLLMMISLRDPLRDTLSYVDFSMGVVFGCGLLALFSTRKPSRRFEGLSYIPLLLSFLLSILLILFGSGPSGSDAKVNLFGFQPVEVIKVLVVYFLAGYFAKRWEFMRELKEKGPVFQSLGDAIQVPRLDYLLPVLIGMGIVLIFFIFQKDMGPALVLSFLFLILYVVARNRFVMAAVGLTVLVGGFCASYYLSTSPTITTSPVLRKIVSATVAERIQIWLSPWENQVGGGEQVAQSMWAFATGGVTGTGLGLGNPSMVPAVHTDLILSAVGEELGFAGVLFLAVCYALLIFRCLQITFRATSDYTLFLGLGLTLLIALQTLLITGGALGLIPLSGVVLPFLSFGRTSMLVNFMIIGILASISTEPGVQRRAEFKKAWSWLPIALCCVLLLVLGRAAYIQMLRGDETMIVGALTMQADGVRRYQYNPRIREALRLIPRGSIYDRNNIPLATSDWNVLERHSKDFDALGIKIDQVCSPTESRHYPFGSQLFHLLGDERTRKNWGASNTAYIERESLDRLQGYDDYAVVQEVTDAQTGQTTSILKRDYRDLIPLLRNRYDLESEEVKRFLNRDRDVRTSLDIRLQLRVAKILELQIRSLRREKGAIVILDPQNGDLLACVSYPYPESLVAFSGAAVDSASNESQADSLLDRARFGLYPPGSTFKLVTAMAALRKNSELARVVYPCVSLGGGRVGNTVRGWGAPVRDDISDRSPHGAVNLQQGIVVSCNAFFAQLGTYAVGPESLMQTASLFGISTANPDTAEQLAKFIPQSAYGQGEVVASPFQMARVAATMANGGNLVLGRWVTDTSNTRVQGPQSVLAPADAAFISLAMRGVVTKGTARRLSGVSPAIAGKTGTAEIAGGPSHSWFIGFAPYDAASKSIAFAILVENGGYGGRAAVPMASGIVSAARDLQLIR
ncbi:MAG TPA: FtsW/RodA/SpoVE family cell cycle protein [Blastocatellia bacterium]|nr:FtsW/RodA/SpoVE family cell cycle protein [Blastocatellia bacterium]